MHYRRPSSLAPSHRSSIRRRSGGVELHGNSPAVRHSECRSTSQHSTNPFPSLGQTVCSGETSTLEDQRTVVLVTRPTRLLSDSNELPLDASPMSTRIAYNESVPDLEERRQSETTSFLLGSPTAQQISSMNLSSDGDPPMSPPPCLPTPNFSRPTVTTARPSFLSLKRLAHGWSFLINQPYRLRKAPSNVSSSDRSLLAGISRPQSCRSDSSDSIMRSEGSFRPISAQRTWNSIVDGDTRKRLLASSLSTSNKFTNKWPKPLSMRNAEQRLDIRRREQDFGQVATVLEEGRGLGMETLGRWNLAKWCLLISLITVFAYGAASLGCAILTWFRTWEHADVMYVADGDILILMTLSGSILLFAALVGTSGTLLNSRPILAVYALLLWPALVSILAIGYIAYKRATFSLDRKLNLAWSQYYSTLGRLLIQDSLKCCGYYDPNHDATPSKRCYTRTSLPGCKGKLLRFERANLSTVWSAVFAVVPLHILNIVVALLAVNHVTNVFGKRLMPRKYRLRVLDVRADAERLFGSGMTECKNKMPMRPQMSRASSRMSFREDRSHRNGYQQG